MTSYRNQRNVNQARSSEPTTRHDIAHDLFVHRNLCGCGRSRPKTIQTNETQCKRITKTNGVQIHPLSHGCGDDVGRATIDKEISSIHNQAGGPPSIILHKDLLFPRHPKWVTNTMYKNTGKEQSENNRARIPAPVGVGGGVGRAIKIKEI